MLERSQNFSSINWVREDLDDCLDSVRENLEAFAEDTSRRESLVNVQEALEHFTNIPKIAGTAPTNSSQTIRSGSVPAIFGMWMSPERTWMYSP